MPPGPAISLILLSAHHNRVAGMVSRRMRDHYSRARLAAKRTPLDGLRSQSAAQNEKPAEAGP